MKRKDLKVKFKAGDTVTCVMVDSDRPLTLGKVYTVAKASVGVGLNFVHVEDDEGEVRRYSEDRFKLYEGLKIQRASASSGEWAPFWPDPSDSEEELFNILEGDEPTEELKALMNDDARNEIKALLADKREVLKQIDLAIIEELAAGKEIFALRDRRDLLDVEVWTLINKLDGGQE